MTRYTTIFFLFFATALSSFSKAPSKNYPVFGDVGVRTFEFLDSQRDRPVVVEFWYPTYANQASKEEGPSVWIHPPELRNAPFFKTEKKLPLVIMSHGHNGDRRERTWLVEKLVKKGYLVASVEHYGNTQHLLIPEVTLRFWERPLDISFALDQLLKNKELSSRIDEHRIGFVGYSLGGMTGLSLAGAVAKNVKEIILKYKKNLPMISSSMIDQTNFKEGEKSFKEPRIKAFLLLCPAVFIFPQSSLKKIDAPIGLIATIGDEVLPHKNHAFALMENAFIKKLKIMRKEISHYAFSNRVSEKGKEKMLERYYFEPKCCPRGAVHEEASIFALDFFTKYL